MNDHTEAPEDRAREELLEQYVLGRMSPADRTAFEARLAADPALREALSRERAILEGVRRLGRNDLKQRIASAAQTPLHPGVPWGRVATLAAIVLIVTGIALWQRWFFPATPVQPAPARPAASEPMTARQMEGDRAAADSKAPAAGSDVPVSKDEETRPGPGASPTRGARGSNEGLLLTAPRTTAERTYESGGVVLRDAAPDAMRQNRKKGEYATGPDRQLAKSGVRTEAGTHVDTRFYRVELVPESRAAATGERRAATGASAAGISDTVRFTVRVRGDSVTIALPAGALGEGVRGHAEARVTRISSDSVFIDVGVVRIRGFLPAEFDNQPFPD